MQDKQKQTEINTEHLQKEKQNEARKTDHNRWKTKIMEDRKKERKQHRKP